MVNDNGAPEQDAFEERVRAALRREADTVEPSGSALQAIQERTTTGSRGATMSVLRHHRWLAVSVAGLATAAAVTGAVALSGTLLQPSAAPGPAGSPASQAPGTPEPTPEPAPSPEPSEAVESPPASGSPESPEPSEPAPEPTQEQPAPQPETANITVPVYYLGETTTGSRLFREFHAVETSDPRAVAALDQMLGQRPLDADYATRWANGSRVRGVDHSGGLITVDLSADVLDTRVPRETADLMVQQLVYTVTAALQASDPVRVLVEGEPVRAIAGSPTAEPIRRADPLEVQALTWVTAPFEGATVPGTFRVEGVAAAFEATVSWQLLDGPRVVRDGFSMTSEGMAFSPYSFRVRDVAPGRYTLKVYQQSAEDGSDTFVDTKAVTVE